MKEIKLKGKKYLLIENLFSKDSGAIATKKQYQNGLCSYAQLCTDGRIMRYKKQIGTIDDIEFGKEVDIKPKVSAFDLIGKFLNMEDGWRY